MSSEKHSQRVKTEIFSTKLAEIVSLFERNNSTPSEEGGELLTPKVSSTLIHLSIAMANFLAPLPQVRICSFECEKGDWFAESEDVDKESFLERMKDEIFRARALAIQGLEKSLEQQNVSGRKGSVIHSLCRFIYVCDQVTNDGDEGAALFGKAMKVVSSKKFSFCTRVKYFGILEQFFTNKADLVAGLAGHRAVLSVVNALSNLMDELVTLPATNLQTLDWGVVKHCQILEEEDFDKILVAQMLGQLNQLFESMTCHHRSFLLEVNLLQRNEERAAPGELHPIVHLPEMKSFVSTYKSMMQKVQIHLHVLLLHWLYSNDDIYETYIPYYYVAWLPLSNLMVSQFLWGGRFDHPEISRPTSELNTNDQTKEEEKEEGFKEQVGSSFELIADSFLSLKESDLPRQFGFTRYLVDKFLNYLSIIAEELSLSEELRMFRPWLTLVAAKDTLVDIWPKIIDYFTLSHEAEEEDINEALFDTLISAYWVISETASSSADAVTKSHIEDKKFDPRAVYSMSKKVLSCYEIRSLVAWLEAALCAPDWFTRLFAVKYFFKITAECKIGLLRGAFSEKLRWILNEDSNGIVIHAACTTRYAQRLLAETSTRVSCFKRVVGLRDQLGLQLNPEDEEGDDGDDDEEEEEGLEEDVPWSRDQKLELRKLHRCVLELGEKLISPKLIESEEFPLIVNGLAGSVTWDDIDFHKLLLQDCSIRRKVMNLNERLCLLLYDILITAADDIGREGAANHDEKVSSEVISTYLVPFTEIILDGELSLITQYDARASQDLPSSVAFLCERSMKLFVQSTELFDWKLKEYTKEKHQKIKYLCEKGVAIITLLFVVVQGNTEAPEAQEFWEKVSGDLISSTLCCLLRFFAQYPTWVEFFEEDLDGFRQWCRCLHLLGLMSTYQKSLFTVGDTPPPPFGIRECSEIVVGNSSLFGRLFARDHRPHTLRIPSIETNNILKGIQVLIEGLGTGLGEGDVEKLFDWAHCHYTRRSTSFSKKDYSASEMEETLLAVVSRLEKRLGKRSVQDGMFRAHHLFDIFMPEMETYFQEALMDRPELMNDMLAKESIRYFTRLSEATSSWIRLRCYAKALLTVSKKFERMFEKSIKRVANKPSKATACEATLRLFFSVWEEYFRLVERLNSGQGQGQRQEAQQQNDEVIPLSHLTLFLRCCKKLILGKDGEDSSCSSSSSSSSSESEEEEKEKEEVSTSWTRSIQRWNVKSSVLNRFPSSGSTILGLMTQCEHLIQLSTEKEVVRKEEQDGGAEEGVSDMCKCLSHINRLLSFLEHNASSFSKEAAVAQITLSLQALDKALRGGQSREVEKKEGDESSSDAPPEKRRRTES